MIITTTGLQLFQMLKQKYSDKEAEALVYFVVAKLKENNEADVKVLVAKEDVVSFREDFAALKLMIADTKNESIRWLFTFFFILMLAILGLYFKK